MFCPSCSRVVPDEAGFCPWCGKALTPGFCPNCGAKAPEGVQYCLSCGKPLTKQVNPTAPLPSVGNVAISMNAAPPQGGTQAATYAQDSYRPLTVSEVEALKQAAAWEVKIGQVFGAVTIFWGIIGIAAPVDPVKFGFIGLIPGLVAYFAGMAARQKMMTANQAIANGRAVEYAGNVGVEAKSQRRVDFDGGHLTFAPQRVPKALDEATRGRGSQLRLTFTEGGTEAKTGTETMILAVNGASLAKPVLGTVRVGQ